MRMQVVSAFFLQREKNGIVEKVKTRMKHILVFFVSVCFPSKRSVPFRQKVRTFLHKSTHLL